MTYGGIFPTARIEDAICYHCGKSHPTPDHFGEAMKAYFHGSCVTDFLATKKGRQFLEEGYHAYINSDGILKKLG